MKIGELSKLSGCSIQTIRYYEKEALLSPPMRTEGNFRIYNEKILKELLFIKQCRNLDITLSEIKELLVLTQSPNSDCAGISNLIEQHISQVDQKISELNELKSNLLLLQKQCPKNNTIEECGILKKLKI